MNRYAIRRNNRNKIVGILNYDEKEKKYTIEIPENVTPKEAPFMISLFLKKGIRTMNQIGVCVGYRVESFQVADRI